MEPLMNANSNARPPRGGARKLCAVTCSLRFIPVLVLSLFALPVCSLAQSGGPQPEDASNDVGAAEKAAPDMTQAEILRELQSMRANIGQLEAALRRQPTPEKAESSSDQPRVASIASPPVNGLSSSHETVAAAAESAQPKVEKPPKA